MTAYTLDHVTTAGPSTVSTHASQREAIDAAKAMATIAYFERGDKPILWRVYLVDGRVFHVTKS